MIAAIYHSFGGPVGVEAVPEPVPPPDGAIVRVRATGLCLSDWHGWKGHDPAIRLPHVPGHELAGEVAAVGDAVRGWQAGDRVTAPFVNACGRCVECLSGNAQVCPDQRQPGFTHWGSFAEYVVIEAADTNLVRLPDEVDFVSAASLGCRFATAFRGVVTHGQVAAGHWVAVHGCGGLGLAAVMIAAAAGARVVAIDTREQALWLAEECGAAMAINANAVRDIPAAVRDTTDGGAHVSIDAAGHVETCVNSVSCLRRRGIHVQLGLLLGDQSRPPIPMDRLVAHELRIAGGHGMPAHAYGDLLNLVASGRLRPGRLVRRRVSLEDGARLLTEMDRFTAGGVTVIDRWE